MENNERHAGDASGDIKMDTIVTVDLAKRAVLFAACRIPRVGTPVGQLTTADLIWAERILTNREKAEIGKPLWTFSGYGSGYGYGSGSGYGSGYGDGSGSGSGDGSGYGSGSGDGSGDGSWDG